MKIKNMKLMLLSLFGLMSVNAMAGDIGPAVGATIQRANLAFEVTKRATDAGAGKVTFLGMVASPEKQDADGKIANQPDGTITIPATVWTIIGGTGNKANYDVTEISTGWATYGKDVTATLKKLVSEVVEKDGDGKVISNLKATNFTALTEVVLPAGQTLLATDAFSGCTALATINLANIADYGSSALKNTAITSIDLTNAKNIGASVFEGINTVKTVSIPATVETIGADAFKGMYKAEWTELGGGKDEDGDPIDVVHPAQGLEELTFNAYSDATKGFATIPAAFSGDNLLKKVTITSTKATGFDASAFAGTASLEELDLSGCTALTEIAAGVFAASPFKSIKLAGTKLKTIANLNLSNANRTLATITFPTTFGKGMTAVSAFGSATKFQYFIALTELDLSATKITQIPDALCEWDEVPATVNPITGEYIKPVLTTVALNPETTSIGIYAFCGQSALATVTGLNQDKLTAIGKHAFDFTAMTAVDLSAATNGAFTTITKYAFGNMPNLTTITLPDQISVIEPAAFANDGAVTAINLQDLKKLSVLNPIFHEGVVNGNTSTYTGFDLSTITTTNNEVSIPITSLTLPEDGALWAINPGALQLLNIKEINMPATVQRIGVYALQGCISLEKFSWNEAGQRWIENNTFRGDDHMKVVKMVTTTPGSTLTITGATSVGDPVDLIFKGNSKDELTFIVNTEDYQSLLAAGWTEANLKFCTLTTEGASEFEFKASSKTGEYYYATYNNASQATWFPEENFEVFSAVVEGSDVVLKPAASEGGYFKVKKSEPCIIRSKVQKAEYELKNASFNNISTMPTDNELIVATADFTPSRLKYQYKLAVKSGVVAFYRVVSGTIKKNTIYIQASTASDRLNIVLEGEATAINGVATKAAENNGAIYNLNGVRVKSAQKGIYIQNGKKYVK